jgi:hypothetical protein
MQEMFVPSLIEIGKMFRFKLDVLSTPWMPPHAAKVLMPCLIFSKFKGDNCKKLLDQQFQSNKS